MSSKNNPTRTRILEAALSLLETGDAARTRMSDIAKAAKISRQALYLHFPNRAELLVATVRYIDEKKNIDARLGESRTASSGAARLDAWISVWGNYIPEIYGIAKALMAISGQDTEARAAWEDRQAAIRDGCRAAVMALKKDAALTPHLSNDEATDILWTLMSVHSWEDLCMTCNWSQERYIREMQRVARAALMLPE